MGWMMIFGGIVWLLLLILAVVTVVWVVRGAWSGSHDAAPRNEHRAALEILHERYARGEIDRD